MWDKIIKWLSAAGGAVLSFFSGLPPLMWVLLATMSLDYLTGLACAARGKSNKSETGHLSSTAARDGLLKKGMIFVVVLLGALLDYAITLGAGVQFSAVTGACCLWFIASEGISIVENAAGLGIPIPGILRRALEIMREKGDADKPTNGAPQ